MAGLPVLLGLGMDFAIQFHNRYEEELARGDTPAAGLIDSLTHIGPAVGPRSWPRSSASSRCRCRRFRRSATSGCCSALGVAILFVVALIALNALLYRFDKPRSEPSEAGTSGTTAAEHKPRLDIGRYLAAVSSFAVRRGPIVVAVATLLAVGGFSVDHLVPVQTDIQKLVPADAPGLVAMNDVATATGSSSTLQFLVTAPDVTSPAVLAWVGDYEAREMKAHSEIVGVTSLAATMNLTSGSAAPSAGRGPGARCPDPRSDPSRVWSRPITSPPRSRSTSRRCPSRRSRT
jgi:predicted RND superfamily exporter protein